MPDGMIEYRRHDVAYLAPCSWGKGESVQPQFHVHGTDILQIHRSPFRNDVVRKIESIGLDGVLQKTEALQVTGHRELLRRALDNILRNGLRFAHEAGSVRVDVTHSADKRIGIITIQDDGPGIAADQEEIIFEPFVTLPNSATGANEGSGLGLTIARQAVIVNGEKIFARGSKCGGGLTVTLELPISVLEIDTVSYSREI